MVVHSLTVSDDQLISSPIDCSDSEAPTPISNLSRDDVDMDLKGSSDGSNKVSHHASVYNSILALHTFSHMYVSFQFIGSKYVGIYICM